MSKDKALAPVEAFALSLNNMKDQFKAALPAHVTPEKFTRVLLTSIRNNEKILLCERNSLFSAVMKCAQQGLLPDGEEAAIVPFGSTAQLMPMTKGILKKIRNSGELASISAEVVHQYDIFKYWIDENGPHLNHEPNFLSDRGEPMAVYALAKTKDGAVYSEILTKEQVMAIKNVSRSKDSGPWKGSFELEMWKKSAIRRLSKRLPMSTDLEEVIKAGDDDTDFSLAQPSAPAATNSSRLTSLIESKEEPVSEQEPSSEEGEVI